MALIRSRFKFKRM